MEHECVIGMIYDYDNTQLVIVAELKEHIQRENKLAQWIPSRTARTVWTLAQYCDRRYNTDLRRFKYCPDCGKRIDWKAIKEGKA